MASWTDGAAYAPTERPDGFATPVVAPLPLAEPAPAITPGAVPPPREFAPAAHQQQLNQIGGVVESRRDPREAFVTSSATLTAGMIGGVATEVRDPRQPFVTAASTVDELPPPTGAPLPPPSGAPLSLPSGPVTGYPVPVPANQWAPPDVSQYSGPAPLVPVTASGPNHTALFTGAGFLTLGALVPSMAILLAIAMAIMAANVKSTPSWLRSIATSMPVVMFVGGLILDDANPFFRIMCLAGAVAFLLAALGGRRRSA